MVRAGRTSFSCILFSFFCCHACSLPFTAEEMKYTDSPKRIREASRTSIVANGEGGRDDSEERIKPPSISFMS